MMPYVKVVTLKLPVLSCTPEVQRVHGSTLFATWVSISHQGLYYEDSHNIGLQDLSWSSHISICGRTVGSGSKNVFVHRVRVRIQRILLTLV